MKRWLINAWNWIKKNFKYILYPFALILGAVLGRTITLRGAKADIAKLRADYIELERQADALREELSKLRDISTGDKERLASIAKQLDKERAEFDKLRDNTSGAGEDIDKLAENNKRFADWIAKYGKEVSSIQSAE